MSDDTGSGQKSNPFIIPPPPPPGVASSPDAPAEAPPEPPVTDAASYIDLPPGVIDSATFKVEPARVVRAPRAPDAAPQKTERSNEEITFFPTPIGGPAVVPEAPEPSKSTWVLTLPDGIELTLDGGRMLVGRNPSAPEPTHEGSGIRLVSVTDPLKSVSKTHAEFELRGGEVFVTDLGSTNGIAIGSAGQEDELVTPGEATVVTSGRIVALGTFEILVARR